MPTPPRVTCITHGVFELPTTTGEPIIFTVPAGYLLYVGEIAPTADVGNAGDWYIYINTGGVYRKTNPTTWTLATTWGGTGVGTGTVTSVDVAVPAFLSVSGGPITNSGVLTIAYSGAALPVANGGSGRVTHTPYAPIFGGTTTTAPAQSGTVGTAGQVLTSNGAGAIATFQTPATPGTGTVTNVSGVIASGVTVGVTNPTTTPARP